MEIDNPLVTMKEIIDQYESTFFSGSKQDNDISRMYRESVDECFLDDERKAEITRKHMDNSRAILDKYTENEYFYLQDKIKSLQNICRPNKCNPSDKSSEEEKHVMTKDFQVALLGRCKNHKEAIRELLKLKLSGTSDKRREFNTDLYHDIFSYFSDKIWEEQSGSLWIQK